jgi:hypothetical protein
MDFKTIDELENSGFSLGLVYELLSRDEFTGFIGKNNKEIYEGDILKTPGGNLIIVEWDEYNLQWKTLFKYTRGRHPYNIPTEWMEVVGNITENPRINL